MTTRMVRSSRVEPAWIGGVPVYGDRTIAVIDPATGATLCSVPDLGACEAGNAVTAAAAALPAWRGRTAVDRADILLRLHEIIARDAETLAVLLSSEQGKPLAEARGEIGYANAFVRWFAEEARRSYGETIPAPDADQRIMVLKQAIGVVAAITPWNFPAAMVTRKLAPALAAGCTVVLKPAEQTPLTALALARLAHEAGVPAGVFNVVTGNAAAIGAAWTANPAVRKISFTGSTEVGALLYRASADTIKKLGLELGGNAPFIVFNDADVEAAADGAIAAKYRNAGQTCVCANRFYVQAGIYDRFVDQFCAKVADLRIGPATDPSSQIGPIIDAVALRRIDEAVRGAVADGATVLVGGLARDPYYMPTVLSNVSPDNAIVHDELFGPVAPIVRFDDEAEVIAMANRSEYGLAAYFYARDIGRIWRVAEALETGMVGVNTGSISTEVAPFGGVKRSGLGREGSRHGLEEFQEFKYVCLDVRGTGAGSER